MYFINKHHLIDSCAYPEHLEGRANKAFEKLAFGTDFRRHVEWVVKGSSGSEIEVTAVAERAGTVRCRLRLDSQKEA